MVLQVQRWLNWKPLLGGIFIFSLLLITFLEWKTMLQQESQNKIIERRDNDLPNFSTYVQPKISDAEDLVVIYNRVPKTGSTSFVNVAYDLCKKNHFRVLHINVTGNLHVLSLQNQMRFVDNVTHWDAMKPALYHGHMAFVDFHKFGVSKPPLFINLIRRPLDRLVSYYYFLRYGDNYRPHLVRRKAGDTMSFDDCVAAGLPDCKAEHMWLQVPFFCGHAAECWRPGSRWAVEEAKRNLIRNYLLVGLTENMEDFIRVLEVILPRLFAGATNHYLTSEKSHLRVTSQKGQPSPATVSQIEKSEIWKLENEFYKFAAEQFQFTTKRMLTQASGERTDQIFFYEKIRPK